MGLNDEITEWKVKGKVSYLGGDMVCNGLRANKEVGTWMHQILHRQDCIGYEIWHG